MTSTEQEIIKELDKCDFSEIHKYFVDKSEARKALPKEEKQVKTVSYDIWGWRICFRNRLSISALARLLSWCYSLTWDPFGLFSFSSISP